MNRKEDYLISISFSCYEFEPKSEVSKQSLRGFDNIVQSVSIILVAISVSHVNESSLCLGCISQVFSLGCK